MFSADFIRFLIKVRSLGKHINLMSRLAGPLGDLSTCKMLCIYNV